MYYYILEISKMVNTSRSSLEALEANLTAAVSTN